MSADSGWRRCSSCKKEIGFTATYWVCNVSTCNRKRTGLVFCTTSCWDVHLPAMNHREAWAEERRAPTREEWRREQEAERKAAAAPARPAAREPAPPARPPAPPPRAAPAEPEVLVVVSKVKAYVRERSGMSTSDSVSELLSERVRRMCDQAIQRAQRDGRRTVMDRDF
jgi:sRNA-binding protein